MNQESLWPSGLGYSPCLELHRIRYSLQRWRWRVGAKGCHVYREGQECRATTLKSLSLAQSLFTQHNNCFSLSCIAMNFIRQSPSLGYKFLRSLLICFYFLLPKHLEHSLKTYLIIKKIQFEYIILVSYLAVLGPLIFQVGSTFVMRLPAFPMYIYSWSNVKSQVFFELEF